MFFSILSVTLPLFSALSVFFFGRFLGVYTKWFVIQNMFLSLLFSIFSFYSIMHYDIIRSWKYGDWFSTGDLVVEWGFLFDNISTLMIFTVCLVSFCVHVYSCYYMDTDPGLTRFLGYLSFFTFFMLFLLSSDNLIQFFIGWEGVGLCSYLLINFWYTRIEANRAAIKAVLVNRVGDCFLLLGVAVTFKLYGTFEFSLINSLTPKLSSLTIRESFLVFELNSLEVICFLFIIAAMCKSAQIFFHIWLPDAMEGPTPVSALIHAATMVTAGVFLIIKCSILFEYTPRMLAVLVVVGALTSLLGATASLFQHDVKKVIAYSTCSQLGYMVVACGISRYDIAFFHLVNHAFFKAVLFLGAGVIIHSLAGEQDMRRMGGLKNKLLAVYALMLIASFALAGVPYLSGFYSKDLILGFSYSLGERVGFFGYLMCILAAIFTSLYSAKLLHLVFYVSPKGIRKTYSDLHSPGGFALLPIFILGIASIFSGFYLKDLMVGVGSNFFDGLIFISAQKDFVMDVEYIDSIFFKLLPFFVGISGFVYYFLKRAQIFKAWNGIFGLSCLNYNNFITGSLAVKTYSFFSNIWYLDFLSSVLIVNTCSTSLQIMYYIIDKGIIYMFGPEGFVKFILSTGTVFNTIFSKGNLYHYISFSILSFGTLLLYINFS